MQYQAEFGERTTTGSRFSIGNLCELQDWAQFDDISFAGRIDAPAHLPIGGSYVLPDSAYSSGYRWEFASCPRDLADISVPTAAGTESTPVPVKRGRGRPRKHESAAARQASYRERKGVVQCNVELPADLDEALEAYMARQQADGAALTKSQVIAKLLRTQLLRKR